MESSLLDQPAIGPIFYSIPLLSMHRLGIGQRAMTMCVALAIYGRIQIDSPRRRFSCTSATRDLTCERRSLLWDGFQCLLFPTSSNNRQTLAICMGVRQRSHTAANGICKCRGQQVIYTTPLKALSNQKLSELRDRFGHETVGLQTGDASLNMDAQIVVMTTEILRNIMYRADTPVEGKLCLSVDFCGFRVDWKPNLTNAT